MYLHSFDVKLASSALNSVGMGQHHVILVIMVITTSVLVIVVIIILSSLLLLEASSYLSRQFIGKSGQTILLRSFSLLSADELWAAVRLMTVFFCVWNPGDYVTSWFLMSVCLWHWKCAQSVVWMLQGCGLHGVGPAWPAVIIQVHVTNFHTAWR